jgi:hypothetical protein
VNPNATLNGIAGQYELDLGPPAYGSQVLSLGSNTPPQWQGYAETSVLTTDTTTRTLATIAVPEGSSVRLEFRIVANLAFGQVNANLAPCVYAFAQTVFRTGTVTLDPMAQPNGHDQSSDVSAPFLAFGGSSGSGKGFLTISGNDVLIQCKGFSPKETWTTGHTYTPGDGSSTLGDFVTSSGNVYRCVFGGVAGATPPSGTGTLISDGTCFWAYVGPGTAIPVRWTLAMMPGQWTG